MTDVRLKHLASQLVNYSCQVRPGDRVLIESFGPEVPVAIELVKAVYAAGGLPFVNLKNRAVERCVMMAASDRQLEIMADYEAHQMALMDAYIGVRAGDNNAELSDVSAEQMGRYHKLVFKPVHHKIRIPRTRWVVLRYPTPAMAQQANMSTEAFEDFYFRVCNLNYADLSRSMDPLVALMKRTDLVHITAPGTDLCFSIKNMPVVKCAGEHNIPDGEVFTAPVRESVEGYITYNTLSLYQGKTFEGIRMEFKQGRIVKAEANDNDTLHRILDMDEGARYIGEFALGVNPFIVHPMKDTLFDEKICGSLHFTPGNCYDDCSNGNHSAIHWDLVLIQRPEYGGGSIYFDDRLIRQDGSFTLPELSGLNPEHFGGR